MNEKSIITNQENPYAQYEPEFDILPLPSKGLFYPEVDGKKITDVKVYHLTASDESIMTSPNLIRSGNLLDVLLEKKVKCAIPTNQLLAGDRLAILIYLRATMEQMYKVELIDPATGKPFPYEVDLGSLSVNEITHMPNQDGHFDFILPKSKKRVIFRLMTGLDETIIRQRQKSDQELRGVNSESQYTLYKLEQTIIKIEGIENRLEMSQFLKNMPLMDSRKLLKFMNDVSPTINMEIEVEAPSGSRFREVFPFTAEFFYPTI